MPLLEINNLSKRFGGLKAVSEVTFAVDEGEVVGLIGPNGAGKTTVFNLITGIVPADSGTIMFLSKDLVGYAPHDVAREGIARTFQNIRLFKNMTVLDNVRAAFHCRLKYGMVQAAIHGKAYSAAERQVSEQAEETLSRMGLLDKADQLAANLPYGSQRRLEIAERAFLSFPRLRERRGQLAGTLSRGEQQMLAIGRGLMSRPSLLLLDEPSMGLAPILVDEIFAIIKRINQEGTTKGPADEMRTHPRVRSAYLGEIAPIVSDDAVQPYE